VPPYDDAVLQEVAVFAVLLLQVLVEADAERLLLRLVVMARVAVVLLLVLLLEVLL
jgi:hypothetical protein